MKYLSFFLSLLILFSCNPDQAHQKPKPKWAIVIHGGAGNINPDNLSLEKTESL